MRRDQHTPFVNNFNHKECMTICSDVFSVLIVLKLSLLIIDHDKWGVKLSNVPWSIFPARWEKQQNPCYYPVPSTRVSGIAWTKTAKMAV